MTPAEDFAHVVERHVRERYALDPVAATAAGIHDHDDRLPDLSARGFAERDSFVDRWISELDAFVPDKQWPIDRTDHDLLLADLRAQRDLRPFERWRRDPGLYASAVIRGAYYLLIREETPREERMSQLAARLAHAHVPLAAARENLDPERTPPVWVVTAGEQAAAGAAFVRAVIPTLVDEDSPAKRDLLSAGQAAGDALDAFAAWLRDDLMHRARGGFAVGTDVFDALLRDRELLDHDAGSLQRFGQDLFRETNLALDGAARAMGDSDWRDSVARLREDHPAEDELVAAYRAEMERSRDATRIAELATFPPDEELVVEAMPDFARPTAPYALYVGAAPFERSRRGRFWVTLPPASDPETVKRERLEGHARAGIPIIACHEGYPGHHLQLSRAADTPSLARKAVRSNVLVEGWGLYVEELMTDLGYLRSPETRLLRLKDLLWRAARVIVDVGLATGSMSFDQAVRFLVDGPKLERPNAIAEVRRYTYDPLQPSSYALGREALLRLRERARREGFGMRRFHDAVLAAGSLPPKLLEAEVFLAAG
ncbi:MAG: DUF885 domain-containing protein [Chloroflexota bacterium]|nr:DUF885 domain-containing protein [Chloroflexota bacterium]